MMRAWLLLPFLIVSSFAQIAGEAAKYHGMLLKRPQAGLVYDRFFAAWLETGTVESLEEFLSKRTETAADWLVLAIFHEQRGHEAEALKAYTAALEREAANAVAWVQRAKLEARTLDFTAALMSLEQTAAHADADLKREVGKLRGRWLLRTGQPEVALQAWRDLLKAHPADADLADEIIDLLIDEGLFVEAAAQMAALITRSSDAYEKATRQLRLAEIMLRSGKKDVALTTLTETLGVTGQGTWIEAEVLAQIDTVFRQDENLTGLVTKLEELQKAYPQRMALEMQRARVLAELGEKDKALAIYAALLEKTPGQRELRESYLDLLARFEKFSAAIAQTKLLMEQSPDDQELRIRLATLQERARDQVAAKATLDGYLTAKGITEFDHLRVARLYENWQRAEDAAAAYSGMVRAFPASNSAKEAQAHYLHRSGKREPALAVWRELARGELPQLMAVGQALMTRLEPQAALELLLGRYAEFAADERFLGLLINAALSAKKTADAIPWALARVRATQDVNRLDDALRQCVLTLAADEAKLDETLTALKQATLSPQERLLLAALLDKKDDRLGAEQALRGMPTGHALAAQLQLLRLMETRQDWPQALQEAEKLVGMPQGKNSSYVQRLVDLAERCGKPELALQWIKEWKILSPGSTQPWFKEARLMQQGGQAREALQVLTTAARKFEDDDSVADALATAHAELGQLSEAERIYVSLFEKEQRTEDKLRWVATLARVANERGQIKALTEKFTERQRTNRADATPWLALAEIHRTSGNTTEQERAMHEALRLRPDDVELAMQLARMDLELGKWKEAIAGLERIAGRAKGGRVQQMIASIQIEFGDENTGYRMLYEMAGGDAIAADDALTMAKSISAKRDWKRTLTFTEPQLRRFPDDYRLHYLHAVALEEEGQADAAVALFIQLMGWQSELPAVMAVKKPINTNLADLEQRAPKGYFDLMRMIDFGSGYQAYTYRASSRSSTQGASKAVNTPTNLDNLRGMSVAHLTALFKAERTEKRAAWLALALQSSFPGARFLDVLDIDQYQRLSLSAVALEKYPDDEVILAKIVSDSARATFATAARAYAHFKGRYPDLALQAARQAAQADPARGAPMLAEVLTELEKLSPQELLKTSPRNFYLGYMIGGAARMQDTSRVVNLPAPLRQRILALMLRQLDTLNPALPKAAYASCMPYMLNACRTQQAWKEFTALVEREERLWREHEPTRQYFAKSVTQYSSLSRRQLKQDLITSLPFPGGAALPPTLPLYFSRADMFDVMAGGIPGPEPEVYAGLKPHITSVKSAALRALLAYKAGEVELAEKEIQQLVAATKPSVEDLLLAASWFGITENHDRVLELLMRASSMALPSAERPAVDAALVHAAVKSKPAATSPQTAAAQAALRRLRGTRVTLEQKDELLTAMNMLHLAEEARQWSRIVVVLPSTTTRRSSSVSSLLMSSSKLKQLIMTKDDNAIVKEAVTQLRAGIASASSYGSSISSISSYRVKEIWKLLRPDLAQKVHAAFDPGSNASVAKLIEQVQFLQLVDLKPKAIEVLEKILEANPKHDEARLLLCSLIAPVDAERAVKLLADVPLAAFQKSNLSTQIKDLLGSSTSLSFEGRVSIITALTDMLEAAPPTSVKDIEWMIDLPAILARPIYSPTRLGFLYARTGALGEIITTDAVAAQRRREVHDKLCRAMLKHAPLAQEGFRRLACLTIQEGKNLDELALTACVLLEAGKMASGAVRSTSSSNEVTALWSPTPEEFLLWHAWKQNKLAETETGLFAQLDSTRQGVLRSQLSVWTCPPEDFAARAKAFLNTNSGRRTSSYVEEENLVWLADRWEERDIPGTPLDDLMAGSIARSSSSLQSYALTHYLKQRLRLRPEAGLDALLRRLVTTTLGVGSDPAAWKKAMKSIIDNKYGGGSISLGAPYSLLQTSESLLGQSGTFGAGLQLATLLGATEHAGWARRNNVNADIATSSADNALATLSALGWMSSAEQLQLPESVRCTQVEFMQALWKKRDTCRDLLPKLAALKSRTFGVELCEALLQDAPGTPLSALLKNRAADVAKIPSGSGPALMALFKTHLPALSEDAALVKALDPFISIEKNKALAEIEKWIIATRADEITANQDEYDEKLISALRMLIPLDRVKAEKLFLAASKLIEGRKHASTGNGWTARSEVFDELLRQMPKVEAIGFVMQLYHTDTTGQLAMNGWARRSNYGLALLEIWSSNAGGAVMGLGIEAALEKLAAELRDTPHTLMGLVFFDFINQMPASQRLAALNWAVKAPRDHPQAALVRELEYAARLFLAHDAQGRQRTAAGDLKPTWEHYRKHLSNKSVNARVRQTLAHHLAFETLDEMDAACAQLGAAAALESQQQKHCLHGYQYAWIMRAFNRLPVDAAWQTAAQAHWDAWITRYNSTARDPCDWAINSMLRMTAHAGNDDWMREMLRRFHLSLSREPSGIASLLLGGQPKLAAEHFKAEWRGFLVEPQNELLWSKEIVEQLPAFQAACGDPALALLGEIYLSYLKDQAGLNGRESRFKDLAQRFNKTKFTDAEMRKDAVEVLCTHYAAAALIQHEVDALAAKTDLNALAAIDETQEHWRQLKPLRFSLGMKAVQGDVKPNIDAYNRAMAAKSNQSYYMRSVVKETGWGPYLLATWHWSRESAAGRVPNTRAVLPFLDHVLAKTPADLRDLHIADCISLKWFIHLVNDEAAVFDSWRQVLAEEARRDYQRRLSERWEIWNHIRQLASTQKKMPLVTAVLKDEWCAAKYPAAGPGIPNLINDLMQKSKVFKLDELATFAAQIAETLPRTGRTAGEAADYLDANDQHAAAVNLYALAFTQARDDYNLASGYAIKQAEILERTGKKPDAQKVLKELDEKRLGAGAKKLRELALKRLGN